MGHSLTSGAKNAESSQGPYLLSIRKPQSSSMKPGCARSTVSAASAVSFCSSVPFSSGSSFRILSPWVWSSSDKVWFLVSNTVSWVWVLWESSVPRLFVSMTVSGVSLIIALPSLGMWSLILFSSVVETLLYKVSFRGHYHRRSQWKNLTTCFDFLNMHGQHQVLLYTCTG